MKAYPEYKPSGIDWLGDIPSHWEMSKYKYHADSRMGITILKEQMVEEGLPIYSATQDDSILGYTNNRSLLLHSGDFVIPARGTIGYVSKVSFDEATCSQTTICSTNFRNILTDYLLFCCKSFKKEWFFFVDTAIPQITVSQVDNNILPLPPIAEQQAIAAYLDEVVGKIDMLISEKRKQVEDIRAYRISLISEAVTRGLNPDAPLRHSGIDWLGDIPSHWICTKAKYYIDIKSGDPISKEIINSEDSIPVYGGGEIIGFCKEANIKKGTIIIGRVGARCGCVRIAEMDSWATDNALIVTTNQISNYINRLFEAANLNRLNESNAQPLITATKIKELRVPIPPIAEQQAIADYLDAKTTKIDELISGLTKQIDELTEYKQAVITEAVTGKIDVRDYKPSN